MADTPLHYRSLAELAGRLRAREISCREVVAAHLARIEALQPRLNAFITVTAEAALAEADARDRELAAGADRGPLHGLPVGLKDIYATAGVRTTAGARLLADWVPEEDAHTVALLRAAGAVFVGKLNTHEFAFGTTTLNPHYGPARNPWDPERVPGGSSGGSGVAVAAGLCVAATGSDTGGSIRIPAGLCGTVGIKPTYGLVSRHGLVPLSWSLDHAGPLARTVEDTAIVLAAMAGYDPRDPGSVRRPPEDYTAALGREIKGLRVGICRPLFFEWLEPEVEAAVAEALAELETLGAALIEIDIPGIRESRDLLAHVLWAEASAYHERWLRERPEDYGADVRTRLQSGFLVPAPYFVKAQQRRRALRAALRAAFERVDLLASATLPVTAPTLAEAGEPSSPRVARLPILMAPFNLTGFPALSLPCGFSAEGLPIGLMLAGPPWSEARLFQVAYAYEQATEWHTRHPSVG